MVFDPVSFRHEVLTLLDAYAAAFGERPERHALLRQQIARGDDIHSRRTFPGHMTASAFILDPAGGQVLLIRHRSLGRWLQPGGHYEPPETLAASALREAVEETGIQGLALDSWHLRTGLPIDIDSHPIPARPSRDEPEHWHHDVRYVFRADPGHAATPDLAEVHEAAWCSLDRLEAIAPDAVRHMRALGLIGG